MTKKISELDALTGVASTDVLPLVDVSDGTGRTKKATVANVIGAMLPLSVANGGTALTALGAAGTFLKVNGAGTAFEFGAGASAPTGTGLVKVTAGAFDAASSLLVNADVNAAAAIAGSKISPDFGAQTVQTTGKLKGGHAELGSGTVHASAIIRLPYVAADTIIGSPDSGATDRAILSRPSADKIRLGTKAAFGMELSASAFELDSGSTGGWISNGQYNFVTNVSGVQFGRSATADFGGGVDVIGIDNATTNPSTNPTGGGVLYADAGALKWRGSGGTTTTMGPADLDGFKATSGAGHCPSCGTDFGLEWANDAYGTLTVCMRCLVAELGDRPWIVRKTGTNG